MWGGEGGMVWKRMAQNVCSAWIPDTAGVVNISDSLMKKYLCGELLKHIGLKLPVWSMLEM